MRDLCPHCGYDIAKDAVIEAGDIKVDPRGRVIWKGKIAPLTPRQRTVVHSLVKAKGEPLSRAILAERVGYEGDDPDRIINVYMTRIRHALPGAPIESIRGVGLRWAA